MEPLLAMHKRLDINCSRPGRLSTRITTATVIGALILLPVNGLSGCPAVHAIAELLVLDCQFYDAAADVDFRNQVLAHHQRFGHLPEEVAAYVEDVMDRNTGVILRGAVTEIASPFGESAVSSLGIEIASTEYEFFFQSQQLDVCSNFPQAEPFEARIYSTCAMAFFDAPRRLVVTVADAKAELVEWE